jgi:hypothetical protein
MCISFYQLENNNKKKEKQILNRCFLFSSINGAFSTENSKKEDLILAPSENTEAKRRMRVAKNQGFQSVSWEF